MINMQNVLIAFTSVFIVDLSNKHLKIVCKGSEENVNSYWWYDWFG